MKTTMTTTAAQLFLCLTFLGKMMNMSTAEAAAASLSSGIARQQECTDEFKPVVCSSSSMGKENLKESFSNMCIASRDGDYLNIDDCELIESLSVQCTNPYALCAFANCTVNPDKTTASCNCHGSDEPSGISKIWISLIPDEGLRQATVKAYYEACVSSPAGCDGPLELMRDKTPVCNAINDTSLWPTADLVSTYSSELSVQENNVQIDYAFSSWECEAAPGRFVPVCMLAPCRYSAPSENLYHFGQTNVTCTCPLVEVTVDYSVFGGLQDPCSKEVVSEGLYVQVAGNSILSKFADDKELFDPAWIAVENAFPSISGSYLAGAAPLKVASSSGEPNTGLIVGCVVAGIVGGIILNFIVSKLCCASAGDISKPDKNEEGALPVAEITNSDGEMVQIS